MKQNLNNFYANKRVFITGADGFMGSHLTERLLDYAAEVFVYVHSKRLKNLNHIQGKLNDIIVGDISDKQIIELISKINPQIVFHLAVEGYVRDSIKDPMKVNEVNLRGTLHVLESLKLVKVLERFVFPSSYLVYGTKSKPIKEADNFEPQTPYAASKAAAELYCYAYSRTFNLPISIIRFSNVYGPRQNNNVIGLYVQAALKNQVLKLEGGGSQSRDFIYVGDAINALVTVGFSKKTIGEAINFGSGENINLKDLAKKIVGYSGSRSKIINVPQRLGQDMKLYCDNSKAKTLLNLKPNVSIDNGLMLTIEWVRLIYEKQQAAEE